MSYEQSAAVYDLIYTQMKDYAAEAERVCELVAAHSLIAAPRTLLDVACGTALHAEQLAGRFELEGLDLSPEQLAIARRRLPGVKFHEADMTAFELGRRFDVVTCLFSAIGYLAEPEQLEAGIARMAAHLNPGGVLLVEPWLHPEIFIEGRQSVEQVNAIEDGVELDLIRVGRSVCEGRIAILYLDHYLARDRVYAPPFRSVHRLALYTIEEYTEALRAAGLGVSRDEHGLMGRGIFIGVKPL